MNSFIAVIVLIFGVYGLVGVSGDADNNAVANERTANVDVNLSLMQSSVFYGVLSESLVNNKAVNEECRQNMLRMLIGVNTKELWAIKALDASGTSRHSFVWGQNAWLGSKTECDYLNTPPPFSITAGLYKAMDPKLISADAPMPVEFKMLFVNFSSPYKIDTIIHVNTLHRIGLCLPESCRNDEVMNVAQRFFSRQEMNFQKLFNVDAKIVLVRNMELNNFLQLPAVWNITVGILIVIFCVLLLSFFHDLKNYDNKESFSQCFSIVKNVTFITKPTTNISSLSVINGIKPFVCIWVIIVHVPFYSMYAYDNVPSVLQTFESITNQPIYAGFFFVDIFFVLSAILLVFNFMTNDAKMEAVRQSSILVNLKTFGQAVLHRYLRLTPALIFTIAVSHLVSLYIKEVSSFYIDSKFDLYCTQSGWWHSVFYVQNLFYVYDLCSSWTWYLACDMQFYVVVLLLLYVYAKYPKLAVFLYSCLSISALGISFYVCLQADVNSKIDSFLANLGVFYIPPWTRAHPYMAGILTGYIMVQVKDKHLKLKNWVVRGYWSIATVVFILTLFVLYDKSISSLMFAISYSVGRFLQALFWGSAIFMCYLGYGGIFNRFFSSQILAHLNKLSYMMYLLNPVIITVMRAGSESSSHFDMASMIIDVICTVLLTYVFAFCLVPIFEIPFLRLSDRYIMQKKKITSKK